MENHKDERVIYIKDLLFAVLYRWRTVLIVALALALLLGGYRGISLGSNEIDSTASEEAMADYEHQSQTLELEIDRLEDRIDAFSTYINSSPFMTLNPHNVYVSELYLYVAPVFAENVPFEGELDPADRLLGAYRQLLLSKENLNTVAQALDMDGANMEVIVDVSCDYTADMLSVFVRQADDTKAKAVLDVLQTAVNNAQTTVLEIMGEHKMSVLGSSTTQCNDESLALLQSKKNEELFAMKESLKVRIAEQDALVAPAVQPVSSKQILVSAVKYAVLGGVLGFFLAACVIVLVHLARNKVYSRRTLEDQTGLHILGCIPSNKKQCAIDLWLRKLEGRCVEAPEQHSALVAAQIRNLCGTECALLLSGAAGADDRLPILNALETAGCTVIANGDLLCTAETVSAMERCTGIVLLEQCGKSRYAAVQEAAMQAQAIGKPVLGCVLIDG